MIYYIYAQTPGIYIYIIWSNCDDYFNNNIFGVFNIKKEAIDKLNKYFNDEDID